MPETKGFDLSALMGEISKANVSDPGAGRQQIEYIPLEYIDADRDNFYSMDGLDALAGNIELNGLQQPLLVRPADGGRYTVVSGHRRREALRLIQQDGSNLFADGIPCIVDRVEIPDALRRLQLIMANSDTRKLTSADQNAQAVQIEDLLRELVDAGYVFPGRLRDWVSELSGMSRTKLARLKVIRDGLEKTIKKKYYDKGTLREASAYELARLPKDIQLRIVDWHLRAHEGHSSYQNLQYLYESSIKDYAKDIDRLDKLVCKKVAGGGPCENCAGILNHLYGDVHRSYSGACSRTGCCANCEGLTSCKYVCSKMQAKAEKLKKEQRQKNKEMREAEKAAQQPIIDRTRAIWLRFGNALGRANMEDEDLRKATGLKIYQLDTEQIALLEAGEYGSKLKAGTVLPFFNSSYLSEIDRYIKTADALNCSLDYLFLRTDVPEVGGGAVEAELEATAPQWNEGKAPCPGWYAAKFEIPNTTPRQYITKVSFYDGSDWRYRPGGESYNAGSKLVAWYPIPEV